MIPASTAYFAWFGTLALIWLAVQDYTNNKRVDDRRNWFMAGVAVSVISHVSRSIWYVLVVALVSAAFMFYGNKYLKGSVGEADINTISWVILGFGLINAFALAWYFAVFGALTGLTLILLKTFKQKQSIPYYSVLLASFVITNLLIGGY